MGRYANKTKVSMDRSKSEIEKTLARYGATKFMYGWEDGGGIVCFEMNNRMIRFFIPMPERSEFETTKTGRERYAGSIEELWDQGKRQRWRALALVVKAKLEAVETGIASFEEEFLANIMLPDGSTVGQFLVPQIESVYSAKKMPRLLPGVK